jgi:tetratricopeptide (TPR) repeat protein
MNLVESKSQRMAELAERMAANGVVPTLADSGEAVLLAWALKDLSFAVWSTEPARAAGVSDAVAALVAQVGGAVCVPAHAHELQALADWTRAVTHLGAGEMNEAITRLDGAATLFERIGQSAHAVQTQVSKIIALAMLGRYDDAAACGEQAKRAFVAAGDVPAAGRVSLNLASMHIRRGEFSSAARLSREAAVLFARVGDHERSVMADINVADAMTSLADFDEALRIYARARMRAAAHGFPVLEALVDESVAALQLTRGRFDEALRGFERARSAYAGLGMPQPEAIAEKQLADVYLELRLLPEALALYQRAAAHFDALGVSGELPEATAQIGRVHALLGRHDEAVVAFGCAASLYEAQGNLVGAAAVDLARAKLALDAQQADQAVTLAQHAASAFDAAGLPEGELRAQAVVALGRLRNGDALAAMAGFRTTLARARSLQLLGLEVRCLTGLGLAAQALHNDELAQSSFEAAVDRFEEQRQALPGDDLRRAFLTDHLRPYQELLRLALQAHADAATPAAARRVLQRLDQFRARALAERLATGPGAAVDARTVALRERLNRLYHQQQKLSDDGEFDAALAQQTRQLEADLLELARRARLGEKRDSPAPALDSGVDLDALGRALADGDALVEYGVLDDELFACIVTPVAVTLHRQLASWAGVQGALASARLQLEALSQGGAHLQAHLDGLTRRAQLRMAQLHQLVWAPLEQTLAHSRRVIVVAPGQLGQLPFAALHDGRRYLAERWELAAAPSARLALHHLRVATRVPQSVLAIGESSRLDHADREARFVAGLFADARVCVGEQATLASLRRHCAEVDIVHLACHARFRSDNPRFSALQLHDGALTVDQVEGLPMWGNVVVLSACETGLAELGEGDEMVGLVRGFLVAGSARVLASLWPVDDAVTAEFMGSFYEALRGGDRAASALCRAQIATMARHPHPYYWAGFTLHGGW